MTGYNRQLLANPPRGQQGIHGQPQGAHVQPGQGVGGFVAAPVAIKSSVSEQYRRVAGTAIDPSGAGFR
ncbi:hypothetical protein [Hymenobacter antarcticus]|uniref:hypothetical protein n=1 Tax=Hymenobacter antarcticus TaxID=486270 RepID=UPI0031ED93EC